MSTWCARSFFYYYYNFRRDFFLLTAFFSYLQKERAKFGKRLPHENVDRLYRTLSNIVFDLPGKLRRDEWTWMLPPPGLNRPFPEVSFSCLATCSPSLSAFVATLTTNLARSTSFHWSMVNCPTTRLQ